MDKFLPVACLIYNPVYMVLIQMVVILNNRQHMPEHLLFFVPGYKEYKYRQVVAVEYLMVAEYLMVYQE